MGPGLPLGLGKTSLIWFRFLLLPGLGPGMPFLRGASAGAAGAAGVEAVSEALSAEDAGAAGSAVEAGDEASLLSLALEFSLSSPELPEKRPSRPDGSLRTTVPLDRLERPLVEGEEAVVLEAAGMAEVCAAVVSASLDVSVFSRMVRIEVGGW